MVESEAELAEPQALIQRQAAVLQKVHLDKASLATPVGSADVGSVGAPALDSLEIA